MWVFIPVDIFIALEPSVLVLWREMGIFIMKMESTPKSLKIINWYENLCVASQAYLGSRLCGKFSVPSPGGLQNKVL